MKKFFLTTTVPQTLGFFADQCKELKEIYDIRAISTDNERLHKFGEQEGIPVIGIRMERDISVVNDVVSLVKWIWLLLKERPYIVHGNTPKASLLSMVAAWLTCRPVRIYMCHGLRYQGCEGKKRKILILMEKISCFCATQVLCVSQGVREQLAKDGICKMEKSQVILYGSANGVDTDRFNPDKVEDTAFQKTSAKVITFIGRLVRDKGIKELVDAVCRLRADGHNVVLILIGGRENSLDALPADTEKKIKGNNFIVEAGKQMDVRPWLKGSWILALPSYREGFGQVLVEANSMGVPVVASNIIGCNNVVEEGKNGLFCEARDTDSLYNAILKLLTDEDLYNQMAKGCRQYTIDHFGHENVKNAFLQYYNSL